MPPSPPSVTVTADMLDAILAAAAASPAREICGLLFGSDAAIVAALPVANVAADPSDTFEVDPAALFAAHRAERGGGPRLIGHYHSHPRGAAVPSARDQAAAEPGRLWLIVTPGGEARLWRATRHGFDETTLTVDR